MKSLYPAIFSCLMFLLLFGGNVNAQTQAGAQGELTSTEQETSILDATVEAVYPVPAESNLFIPINLPAMANVKIKVYDILGSEVAVLINEPFRKGKQAIKTSIIELDNGHYFLTVEAGGSLLSTQKIVVTK